MNHENDDNRRKVLDYFYGVYRGAEASDNGRVLGKFAIDAIWKRIGGDRAAIASSLEHLVNTAYVDCIQGHNDDGPYIMYRISSRGLELLEAETKLRNVTAPEDAVTASPHPDLTAALAELRKLIESDRNLNPDIRVDALRDLDTITLQLHHLRPDIDNIKNAWQGVKIAAIAADGASLLEKCAVLLSHGLRDRHTM